MSDIKMTPEVLWAQRSSSSDAAKNYIILTIMVPDVAKDSMQLDLKPTSLVFTGRSTSKNTTYHLELEFYSEIDVENSKTNQTARDIEMILRKKEMKEEYWPRLLKESKRVHYLKTDFDKWVDEDEQDAVADDADNMGAGAGGMPGMGGGDGGFGGIDFSKLGAGAGGMGGMGGMEDMMKGMGGMGGMGGGEDDDDADEDDEDMPELEDEASSSKTGGASAATIPKVEEISEAAAKGEASDPLPATTGNPKIEEVS
ncbi:MAG: hypothetical protein M1835_005719 [Candelina submexicana]|nr:MAG: hypothetical protein M1835_005719 [Candelina submexicana]